jgi:arylsulfatase A-like enzyme
MSLLLLDDAVSTIHTAVKDKGIADNTYIIFASDNGGCYKSGGQNGPLRGTKGSLFEGSFSVFGQISIHAYELTIVDRKIRHM